jgi:hypothetical protein
MKAINPRGLGTGPQIGKADWKKLPTLPTKNFKKSEMGQNLSIIPVGQFL